MAKIVFTRHAEATLAERNLDRQWVLRVLKSPEWVEPDTKHAGVSLAFGQVPEREGRVLRVVYRDEGTSVW